VTNINVSDQLLLLEARRELERLIATSAARRRTHGQSAMLAEMAIEMRRAAATDDYLLFLRIDRAFNQCVAESAATPLQDNDLIKVRNDMSEDHRKKIIAAMKPQTLTQMSKRKMREHAVAKFKADLSRAVDRFIAGL
jgi:DNA-binding GntR family transcriptional regulator